MPQSADSDTDVYSLHWQAQSAPSPELPVAPAEFWHPGWTSVTEALTNPQVTPHTERTVKRGLSLADAATALSPARAWALKIVEQTRACLDEDPRLEGLISQIIQGYKGIQPSDEGVLHRLPNEATEIWRERDKAQAETILDFVRRLYQPWIDNGSMNQADLKRLDPSAHAALVNACSYKGILPSTVVPASKNVGSTNELDEEILRTSQDPHERTLARARLNTRRRRRHEPHFDFAQNRS